NLPQIVPHPRKQAPNSKYTSKTRGLIVIPMRSCLPCTTVLLALVAAAIAFRGGGSRAQIRPEGRNPAMLQLTSSAFETESSIPPQFSCEGRNISPELSWTGAPAGTKSFALIMHDPDAPIAGGYTHWLLYNIPATAHHLPENTPNQDQLPGGGMQGKNDAGKYGYTGP